MTLDHAKKIAKLLPIESTVLLPDDEYQRLLSEMESQWPINISDDGFEKATTVSINRRYFKSKK